MNGQTGEWDVASTAGLLLRVTDSGNGSTFDRFFRGYDRAFVLPNEKEDVEGLRACFALNRGEAGARLEAVHGPYREIALVAEDRGEEVGGANFIAMPVGQGVATANLNYIYVNPGCRGRGYLSRLQQAVRDVIWGLFPGSTSVLVFIEQNDPFRMTEADYRRDTAFTGLDQLDRLRIWTRLGARVVDFPYRQPPLSADQEADDTLVYSVLGAEGPDLDACILRTHLQKFFGVSVLKGAGLDASPDAALQIATLDRKCAAGERVGLIDPSGLLARAPSREAALALWAEPPASFLDALKR